MRHGVAEVRLNQLCHILVRIKQQLRQHKGISFLQVGVEVTGTVQENTFHAVLPVQLQALLHNQKDRVGRQVIVKVTDIVPDIYGPCHLFPLLQTVVEGFCLRGIDIADDSGIVYRRQENAHVQGQDMVRKLVCGGISRDEKVDLGEPCRQPLNEGNNRRGRIPWLVAGQLALVALADDAVVVGADRQTHLSLRFFPILVDDEAFRGIVQSL